MIAKIGTSPHEMAPGARSGSAYGNHARFIHAPQTALGALSGCLFLHK